jgi:phytanoyl-CoA hydroxylase
MEATKDTTKISFYQSPAPHGGTFEVPVNYDAQTDIYDTLTTPAAQKEYYEKEGYLIIRNLIPDSICDAVKEAFDKEIKPYEGYIYRQASANPEKHKLTNYQYMLNSILNIQSLDKNKFPKFREKGMEILTSEGLKSALDNLMTEAPKLVQSMYFEGNPATWAHQDSYYLDSSEQGRMVGSWIAVEDINPGAGRFYVYPKSHLIDMEKNGGDFDIAFNHDKYKKLVVDIIHQFKLECSAPVLRKGDVLFWHGKTIHGSLATTQPEHSRSSFTGHYIPTSTDFLQYQSRIKKLNLKNVNGIDVNFPKDQNESLNRLILNVETTFPTAFQTAKKLAIKLVTK